jgi:hypothetical protein
VLIWPVPIAIYNQRLVAKRQLTLTQKKASTLHSKQPFHGFVSITDNGLSYDNTLYFTISKIKKDEYH